MMENAFSNGRLYLAIPSSNGSNKEEIGQQMFEYQKYLEEKNILNIIGFQTIVKGLRTEEAA